MSTANELRSIAVTVLLKTVMCVLALTCTHMARSSTLSALNRMLGAQEGAHDTRRQHGLGLLRKFEYWAVKAGNGLFVDNSFTPLPPAKFDLPSVWFDNSF